MIAALAPFLADRLARGEPAVLARIASTAGSTPREAGAAMVVARGATAGSIGGGQLEFHAIDMARAMMETGETRRDLDIPLGPHLGQCCGGRVVVTLERAGEAELADLRAADARERETAPRALVFGAGHTGVALARALALLPLHAVLVDDRADAVSDAPAGVATLRLDDPGEAVAAAPSGAAFVILTHSHALDYRLADLALRRGDAAYVGMIGSATKRARFVNWFLLRAGSRAAAGRLVCPIGGSGSRDKRPAVIAALTAADVARALFATAASHEQEARHDAA